MIIVLIFFYFSFRRILQKNERDRGEARQEYPDPSEAIISPTLFKVDSAIFLLVVVLLVTHAETGLSVAIIGVIAAVLTLVASGSKAPMLLQRVDWRTLVFFIGLFICVGGLEETGVLKMMAQLIGDISGGNIMVVIPIILWVSAFASADCR